MTCSLLNLHKIQKIGEISLILFLCTINLLSVSAQTSQFPPSPVVSGITFNFATLDERAPGSDNWAITWADDDHQYTTWGDGGGFGGSDDSGRVSLGFARVEGPKNSYQGINVWGGYNAENPPQFTGKSYGIISIDGEMWMWRCGDASGPSAYDFQELYKSTDHSATWVNQGVSFSKQSDFNDSFPLFYAITFCQFGKDYNNARDNYVYMYAPEAYANNNFDVQYPGQISLMRVDKSQLSNKAAYKFFAGLDQGGNPLWTSSLSNRKPAFEDSVNGVQRTSVSYNEGLGRYFLITQQISKNKNSNGHIGIYDAPEPWGPWTTVLFENAWTLGLQTYYRNVYWNFSNKWLSSDGKDFVLVYTGQGDEWGTIEGTFTVNDDPLPVGLTTFNAKADKNRVILNWTTESEINNLGFEIWRCTEENGQYHILSSYQNNPGLEGQGNSSLKHDYTYIDDGVVSGQTYWYKLYDVDYNGDRAEHGPLSIVMNENGLRSVSSEIPENFRLHPNYPNPFNPSTTLRFDISRLQDGAAIGSLTIFNALGQVTKELYEGKMIPGSFELQWDGTTRRNSEAPGGIYFARLTIEGYVKTIKMILIR